MNAPDIDPLCQSPAMISVATLAAHMHRLEQCMEALTPMAVFGTEAGGIMTVIRSIGRDADFAGCYALMDQDRPIYVGTSWAVCRCLRMHVRSSRRYTPSLAHRMAATATPHDPVVECVEETREFSRQFERARAYLLGIHVAFIEILDPIELHRFGEFCAMELGTFKWPRFGVW